MWYRDQLPATSVPDCHDTLSTYNRLRFLIPIGPMHALQGIHNNARSVATPAPTRSRLAGCASTGRALQQHRAPFSAPAARWKPRHVTMVLTESAELPIGEPAPDFELPEPLTGKTVRLSDFNDAKALLVMFICCHCPFVVMLKSSIAALASEYQQKGVAVVAISSNSVQTHPQDGPDRMAEDAKTHGYTFPFLYDESQEVAKAYGAACTPEFFVFDNASQRDAAGSGFVLAYHGQYDNARPKNNVQPTGHDLCSALDAVLSGGPVPQGRPSIGCNIKWAPGQEPAWYGAQMVQR